MILYCELQYLQVFITMNLIFKQKAINQAHFLLNKHKRNLKISTTLTWLKFFSFKRLRFQNLPFVLWRTIDQFKLFVVNTLENKSKTSYYYETQYKNIYTFKKLIYLRKTILRFWKPYKYLNNNFNGVILYLSFE